MKKWPYYIVIFIASIFSLQWAGIWYSDSRKVEERFARYPNVVVTEISDYGDFDPKIFASIVIDNKTIVEFWDIEASHFDRVGGVTISRIGDWAVSCIEEQYWKTTQHSIGLDVGRSAEFFSDLEIDTIDALLIKYRELHERILKFPIGTENAM